MANEYGEIEQLVNDVTSLDTARMTLRWALERLNSIEKEKADLKKNLAITEETARTLQLKDASLQESFDSRYKTLEEKEDFYTKLEATMSLLGEGKLDIQQLLKKEAKLDGLRKSLENEYQDKFEELDHNQRAVIGRWNARLLETESQYAGRLAEAQKKYDALRAELEGDHQGRLTALQAAFRGKEADLMARIAALETSARERDGKIEARRGELEAQYLSQKRETEENYRKLKNLLEAGLEDKLRAMDSDHAAQVRSLEDSWQVERSRLLEEQRVRDTQFRAAQDRIKAIENNLASQQEYHHSELLKIITEKETAFRAQLVELEKEKTAKEERVKELLARLETKSAGWQEERAGLAAEYGTRLAAIESAARERTLELERDYSGKKEELKAALAAGRENFEREFQTRLEMERKALAGEKNSLAAEKALREAALAEAVKNVKELESALAAASEEHHKKLMERISSGEADFREKLISFEAEKTSYKETIDGLTTELHAKEAVLAEEKSRIVSEFEAKAAIYENRAKQSAAAFEEQRGVYDAKLADYSARLNGAAEAALIERETFKTEIARVASETQALAEKRMAVLRVDYDTRKVELEREFVARYGDRLRAIEAEKERMNEVLDEREGQLKTAFARATATDAELAALRKSATDEKHSLAVEYDGKLRAALNAAGEEFSAKETELKAGMNALRAELVSAEEARTRTIKELMAQKEVQLAQAAAERAEAEKTIRAAFEQEEAAWMAEKEKLAADFERRLAQAEAGLSERVGVIRADYEIRKAELGKEFSARYADRLKALEAEKARMDEALAEREGQLKAAYVKVTDADAELAALRKSATDEKHSLAVEYDGKLRAALTAAGEEAAAREAELKEGISALYAELAGRERLLAAEREKLVDELAKAAGEGRARTNERVEAVRSEYETRLAELVDAAEVRTLELKELIAQKETMMEQAAAERAIAEKSVKEAFEQEKAGWLSEKETLAADFERRLAQAEVGLSERVGVIREDYENRKAELGKEFSARYADRLKALEAEKARMDEALAEREGQLKAAYAKVTGTDAKMAELRRSATDEKNALVAEYEDKLRTALKAAGEEAGAREAELKEGVNALRAEMSASSEARTAEVKELLAQKEAQLEQAAAERAGAEKAVREAFEQEKAGWFSEKESLAADFERRLAQAEAGLSERAGVMRADYENRKAEVEKEFEVKFADKVKALEFEKACASETVAIKDDQLAKAYGRVKHVESELENARADYDEKKAGLVRMQEERLSSLTSHFEAERLEASRMFGQKETGLKVQINALRGDLSEKEKMFVIERENLCNDFARAAAEANALAEARIARAAEGYETQKAVLAEEFEAKFADRVKALEFEKVRVAKFAAVKDEQLAKAYEQVRHIEIELEKIRAAHDEEKARLERAQEDKLRSLAVQFEQERLEFAHELNLQGAGFKDQVEALKAELSEKETTLALEREKLPDALAKVSAEAKAMVEKRAAGIRLEYEARETGLEKEYKTELADKVRALEFEKARAAEIVAVKDSQLTASCAQTKEVSTALAEFRRKSADEKAELEREHLAELSGALKTASENAAAREVELGTGINTLRAELEKKDRDLAAERDRLAAEVTKVSAEAHARSEEHAEAIRADYENRLAVREAQLAKALQERALAENNIKAAFDSEKGKWQKEKENRAAGFERQTAELEGGFANRAAMLESDYAARKERVESEAQARMEAVNAEAARKIEYERQNWHAERARFENLLVETSANFSASQKEIEELNSALRRSAEDNSARETRFNRELMEAKANYDRELSFRVNDAVSVQTAHLLEALEAAKAKNGELAETLAERENAVRSLMAEAVEIRRESEERLRLSDSEALAGRRAELEKVYFQKHARLEENMAALKRGIEADYQARREELAEGAGLKDERLAAENLALREDLAKLRASEKEVKIRASGLFEEMVAAGKTAQLEKIALQKAHSEELNLAVAEAVSIVAESAEEKHRLTRQELLKLQKGDREEFKLLEESFMAEKERLVEELARRDKYTEAADLKIQEMELDILKYRQNASGELLKQIAEQDERFREVVRDEKNRRVAREMGFEQELSRAKAVFEARVKQLEDLLSAKEKLMDDGDRFYRQKQLELDGMHTEFNQRVNKFNEELFSQKQAVAEKEKAVNDYRLTLEKEYAAKAGETEKMKAELNRVIMEYKGRK